MTRPRSILITGGASGIGLAITTHFASTTTNTTPTHITLLDVNPNTGNEALNNLLTKYPSVSLSFEQCDTSSWESQARVFERVYRDRGGVDVVFANAGITESDRFIRSAVDGGKHGKGEGKGGGDGPVKPNLKTVDINFLGVVYSVHLAIHYISKNPPTTSPLPLPGDGTGPPTKGTIICTTSNAGLYAFPIAPVYSSTKAAVIALVRSLARGLEKEQIRINGLAPAVIETNIAPDRALFKDMILTPMETAIRGVEMLVGDASVTGKVAELHGEQVTFAEAPGYVDEDTGRNIETFWRLGYA